MLKFYCVFTIKCIDRNTECLYGIGLGFKAKFEIIGRETVYQNGVFEKFIVGNLDDLKCYRHHK